MRAIVVSAALLLLTTTANAQGFAELVLGHNTECIIVLPLLTRELEWTNTNPPNVVTGSDVEAIAIARGSRVIAAGGMGGRSIFELRPDNTRVPIATLPTGFVRSLTVARDGTIYALVAIPGGTTAVVAVSPAGAVVATHTLPAGLFGRSMDLAADQCTLFYTRDDNLLRRFNVCTGTPLADFANALPWTFGDVRVLPDGGVLAIVVDGTIRRFNAAGVQTQVYTSAPDAGAPASLALGSHGFSFWVGFRNCGEGPPRLIEFDLATGSLLTERPLMLVNSAVQLLVARGWTAALGPLDHGAEVPLSTSALVTLAALIALLAMWRMGRML